MRRSSWLLLAVGALAGCRPQSASEALPPGEREPTEPILDKEDVHLELGVRGRFRDGAWTALGLRVRNRGLDFRGHVEVQGVLDRPLRSEARLDPVAYRLPLEVPRGGPARQVWLPIRPQSWTAVQVSFLQPGYRRRHELEVAALKESVSILLVGNRIPDARRLLARLERDLPPQPEGDARIAVTTASERELPPLPDAYEAFDLVLTHGTALGEAAPGAVEALARWVETGGTLVTFPGPDWAGALPERLRGLLGVDIAPTGEFDATVRARAGAAGTALALAPRPGTVALEPGLAYRSRQGAGSVTTFAVAPAGEELPAGPESAWLAGPLAQALKRGVAAGRVRGPFAGGAGGLGGELSRLTDFPIPEKRAVVAGLAFYLALGFLLPAALCRWLRRPWWTYAWIAAAAAAATGFVLQNGLVTARSGTELIEVTFLRPHRDGKTCEATSFVGCFAPSALSVDFWGESDTAEDHPLREARGRVLDEPADPATPWLAALFRDDPGYVADRAGRLRLGPARLRPNTLRRFRFDYRIELDPNLLTREESTTQRGATARFREALPEAARQSFRMQVIEGTVFPGAPEITARRGVLVLLDEEEQTRGREKRP